jgi:hypothetical protein
MRLQWVSANAAFGGVLQQNMTFCDVPQQILPNNNGFADQYKLSGNSMTELCYSSVYYVPYDPFHLPTAFLLQKKIIDG